MVEKTTKEITEGKVNEKSELLRQAEYKSSDLAKELENTKKQHRLTFEVLKSNISNTLEDKESEFKRDLEDAKLDSVEDFKLF